MQVSFSHASSRAIERASVAFDSHNLPGMTNQSCHQHRHISDAGAKRELYRKVVSNDGVASLPSNENCTELFGIQEAESAGTVSKRIASY